MAEQPALPQLHGIRMRVARLDANGVPSPGAGNLYVSTGFTRVAVDPQYSVGAVTERKNASGEVCFHYMSADSFTKANITIELCDYDPYLLAMLTGGETQTDGDRIGWKIPEIGPVTGDGVSIEVWTRRVDDGEEDADSPYGWFAYPRAKNLRLSGWAHEDGALIPTITGQAYENPNWFDGPANDWPIDSDRVVQYIPTSSLPTAQVGGIELAAS